MPGTMDPYAKMVDPDRADPCTHFDGCAVSVGCRPVATADIRSRAWICRDRHADGHLPAARRGGGAVRRMGRAEDRGYPNRAFWPGPDGTGRDRRCAACRLRGAAG